MIIEFPKKYDVQQVTPAMYLVTVPAEYVAGLVELLNKQPWAHVHPLSVLVRGVHCVVSPAYDITPEQARDALCRLCEHVMAPDVELDRDVWNLEA